MLSPEKDLMNNNYPDMLTDTSLKKSLNIGRNESTGQFPLPKTCKSTSDI